MVELGVWQELLCQHVIMFQHYFLTLFRVDDGIICKEVFNSIHFNY